MRAFTSRAEGGGPLADEVPREGCSGVALETVLGRVPRCAPAATPRAEEAALRWAAVMPPPEEEGPPLREALAARVDATEARRAAMEPGPTPGMMRGREDDIGRELWGGR